jgi:hypothetical protein
LKISGDKASPYLRLFWIGNGFRQMFACADFSIGFIYCCNLWHCCINISLASGHSLGTQEARMQNDTEMPGANDRYQWDLTSVLLVS